MNLCALRVLNHGPIDLESDALPTELSRPTHLKVFLVTGVAFVCWSCYADSHNNFAPRRS